MLGRLTIAATIAITVGFPQLQAHAQSTGPSVLIVKDVTSEDHCRTDTGQPCVSGSIRDLVAVPLAVARARHATYIPYSAGDGQRRDLLHASAPRIVEPGIEVQL